MDLIEKSVILMDGTELKVWHSNRPQLPWLIAVHGIAEHSGRHHYLENLLSKHFNILFFDLRGHGQSQGCRGDIHHFDQYRLDLMEVVLWAKKELGITGYSLHGHSMGALITASFIQEMSLPHFMPSKVFLSAPPAGAPGIFGPISNALPASVFWKLSQYTHSISGRRLINNKYLSHDPQIEMAFAADPLNLKDPSLSLVLQIAATYKHVFKHPLNYSGSFRCVIGSDDCLVTSKNLIRYFSTIEKNRDFKVIAGGWHELHNEIPAIRQELYQSLSTFFCSESPRE